MIDKDGRKVQPGDRLLMTGATRERMKGAQLVAVEDYKAAHRLEEAALQMITGCSGPFITARLPGTGETGPIPSSTVKRIDPDPGYEPSGQTFEQIMAVCQSDRR